MSALGPSGAGAGPVVAVGGIAVVAGALLMVCRGRAPEAGRWSVPGGRMEAGESLAEAVEREVREETGLAVSCGALVGVAERRTEGFSYVIVDFAVTPVGSAAPRAGSDAAAAAWVPLAEVSRLPLVEGLKEFLVTHGVVPGRAG